MSSFILRSLFLGTIIASALATHARAATINGQFTFGSGTETSFAYNGAAIPGVTVSNITKNGINSFGLAGSFMGRGWSLGAVDSSNSFASGIDTTDYIEFTLTAEPGTVIDLTSLTFGIYRNGPGPRRSEWRSSVDNFAAAINSYSTLNAAITANNFFNNGVITVPDGASATTLSDNTIDLSGASFQGLQQITFRYYAYNAETANGNGGLGGPLTFTGSTQAIPEPSTLALGGVAALGALLVFRRRRAATSR